MKSSARLVLMCKPLMATASMKLKKHSSMQKSVKGKPCVIIAKTIKGKDVSFMENQVGWHGTAPNKEQYEVAMQDLNKILAGLEAE